MAIAVKIKIIGLNELSKNFRKSPTLVYKGLTTAINKSALILTQNIKKETPKKTGALRGSIRPTFSRLKTVISPNKNYAIYVHEGTRPHIIRPKTKKALYWKGALHPVRMVKHPGTKGTPFMEIGVKKSIKTIERIFQKEVNYILNRIAKK